ncbi:hypothetical protein N7451_000221 [Penicillium sp. IBT 35674x]|nr:hypothetical protein N7451_000221 [Penicillium sp. IBT 35674x]
MASVDVSIIKKTKSSSSEQQKLRSGEEVEDGLMEQLGYLPVYRRVFRSLGNVCMVIALTTPLSAILITGFYQVTYAGYWGLSWGWIIPNILMFPEVLAICELASSMPLNGAFYWWTGALAPPKWSHSLSYITGWLNILQIFTGTAAFAYAVASSFAYSVNIVVPSFSGTNAELMALSMAIVVLWAALMGLNLEKISVIYIIMALLVLIQTIIYLIGLPVTHAVQGLPFASAREVFGSFSTYTDWGAGVAVPYSWFGALWVNSAWMVPVYVSEETHQATTEVPKSLIYTFTVTFVSGLVISLLAAFCITDIVAAAEDATGYPLMSLVVQHWGKGLSAAFFLFVAPVGFIGGSGTLLTYASQIAAFARDGGFPWAERISYIHPRLNLPIYAIGLLGFGTFLVLLVSLSSAASSIIYSLSVVASLITYIIPIAFRIFAGDRWVPGPFDLGKWSIPIHITAVITQAYLIIMECFPPNKNWDASTMNYNFAVTILAILFSSILYVFCGKENFRGLDAEALEGWRRHHANAASLDE